MKILVGTMRLGRVGGAQSFTFTLIEELKKRGIDVEYFSYEKGETAQKIESNLNVKFLKSKNFDLILANHYPVVKELSNLGFTIQTCHGIFPGTEHPSFFADLHVAISTEVQDHLNNLGFRNYLIHNGINCERFSPKTPLSKEIKSVLSLCQGEEANSLVEKICTKRGFEFKKFDKFNKHNFFIEEAINQADLVVGLGRSIYDAISCGRAAIVFDSRDYQGNLGDGYLKIEDIFLSLKNNCSGRALKKSFSLSSLEGEFNKYDPSDGNKLRDFALRNLNISQMVDRYLEIYNVSKHQPLRSKAKKFFFNAPKKMKKILLHLSPPLYKIR